MRRIKAGTLDVWTTGGGAGAGREGASPSGPAIVLCHGFGAPGDDLVPLARVVDAGRDVRWFFPEAPGTVDLGLGGAGRAWWPIDMARLQLMIERGTPRDLAQETPEGMAGARAALEGCLAALEKEQGVDPATTIVGGFSQGAMLASEVVLHAERPFAGLAALSGALVSEDRWRDAAETSGRSIHAIVTHGRRDPILPFDGGRALAEMLASSGAKVRFVPHGGAHEIPPAALDALAELARERLS